MTQPSPAQAQTSAKPSLNRDRSGVLQRQCQSCGQHTIAGECAECKKKQPLQRQAVNSQAIEEVPPIVGEVLRSPGQPLDAETRAFMESQLSRYAQSVQQISAAAGLPQTDLTTGQPGDRYEQEADRVATQLTPTSPFSPEATIQPKSYDFSQVRVHTDRKAAESARWVHALAYTVGQDIVFGAGQYAPTTSDGKRLLTHELVHVLQQSQSSQTLLQKDDPPTSPTAGVSFRFSVRITARLSAEELLLEFIRQYRRLETIEQARQIRDSQGWHWTDTAPTVTPRDIRNGYILIHVTDRSIIPGTAEERQSRQDYFQSLSPDAQAELNAEADQQFWERTQYRVGQRLGHSRDDRQMAQYWRVLREELVRQRQAIDALPSHLREFLFNEAAVQTLQPRDYATVLRIAGKLTSLTAAELEDYSSRVTAQTTDLTTFEASIDRYLAEHEQRRQATQEREQIKTRLYGLEGLYRLYKSYRSLQSSRALIPSRDEFGVVDPNRQRLEQEISAAETELTANLARNGFASLEEFEQTIRQYERAFELETLAIADDMLDRYEHILYEAERQYQDPAAAAALHQALSPARPHYEEAERQQQIVSNIRPDPELHRFMPGELEMRQAATQHRDESRRAATAAVTTVAATHPLLQNQDAEWHERLTRAPQSEVQSLLLNYIQQRRQDIAESRQNLASQPELIYRLDTLFQSSRQAQNIRPDSIFDLIIQDKVERLSREHFIISAALAVLAIAAGLLTAGGGTVAVLAAGVSLGIGVWGVLDEFRQYETQSAAYGAQLLSDEPSFGWVIVAVIGAGLDLAGVATAVNAMRPAVQAFNTSHDLVELERSLRAITEVNDQLRANVLRAARAERQYQQAVRGLLATSARLNAVLIPGAEEFARLMIVAYYLAKRGVIAFETFLLELQGARLIGRLEDLTPEELSQLRRAFTEGLAHNSRGGLLAPASLSEQIRGVYTLEQIDEIAARGKVLRMTDSQITDFLEMGSIAKPNRRPPKLPLTPEQVMEQMQNWTGVIHPRGFPYLFESLEQFEQFRDQLRFLVRRHSVPEGRLVVQGSALRNPAARDLDVAIFVSDAEFAEYAARCRAGLVSRTGERARARILEAFDHNVERGFINQFYFDRLPASSTFSDDVHDLFVEPFGFDLDISVMKSSSSLALYPSLDL